MIETIRIHKLGAIFLASLLILTALVAIPTAFADGGVENCPDCTGTTTFPSQDIFRKAPEVQDPDHVSRRDNPFPKRVRTAHLRIVDIHQGVAY